MKILKYSLSLLLIASALTSCKKDLDLLPTDVIQDANAFLTLDHAQLGANEAYGRYGTYANDMYVSALISDEAKLGADNSGAGALTYRYQYSSDATTGGNVISAYFGYYYMLDQVNRVLYNLPKVLANSAEEPRRAVLKGQMLALRAIGHFGVLQSYCKNYSASEVKGIPLMTSYNPNAKPSRATMSQSIAQIETDLNDAYNLLPAVTAATFTDTVMNRVNIDAYRARIALYKGDYANAIIYANNVINSGIKTLATGTAFSAIWTDASSSEVLFRIRYATGTSIGALWTTTGGSVDIAPSDKLIATYGTGDIRKAAYIGQPTTGKNYVNKFYTSSRGGRVVDLKAIRIAEIYLIRAEAYAKSATPNLVAAAADLNALRTQRITGYVNQTFATASDLITAILDERYKELCFEGFRLFDLKRNSLPVQRLASDVTASAWQTLPANDYRFVMPIPFDELLANPNNSQNDGY
jgi:hypothetical protein